MHIVPGATGGKFCKIQSAQFNRAGTIHTLQNDGRGIRNKITQYGGSAGSDASCAVEDIFVCHGDAMQRTQPVSPS